MSCIHLHFATSAPSSRLSPPSLWNTPSWFHFTVSPPEIYAQYQGQIHLPKTSLPTISIWIQPIPTYQHLFLCYSLSPRCISFVTCSKYALMILSCNYVLDQSYGLFHYICRWTVWLYMVIFPFVCHVHLDRWFDSGWGGEPLASGLYLRVIM